MAKTGASKQELAAAVDVYGKDRWRNLQKQISEYSDRLETDVLLLDGSVGYDGLAAFKETLNESQKFFLTDDFAMATLDKMATPETVIKAKEWFRLIHNPMWLEWQINAVSKLRMGAIFYSTPTVGGDDAIMCYVVNGIVRGGCESKRKAFGISLYRILPESIRLTGKGCQIDIEDEHGRPIEDGAVDGTLAFMAYDFIVRLNSPKITEFRPCEDLSKINKKRQRLGSLPLCSYQIVDLTREIKADIKLANSEGEGGVRFHWRRGHFKLLAGERYKQPGLHWWNPHTAGRKSNGEIIKEYVA